MDIAHCESIVSLALCRACKNEHLAPENANGETSDTLFSHYCTLGFSGWTICLSCRYGDDLAVRSQNQPISFELVRCHSDAVIANHQEKIGSEEIDLDMIGICIMCILEQFADCR